MSDEKKLRVVAIIQARMGSTRLPGKVMMDIGGKPMLQRVIERVQRAKTVDEVVVAMPNLDGASGMAEVCIRCDTREYYGSEVDVLDRYARAAAHNNADVIVRITSDCPLIDPDVIDEVVAAFLEHLPDYASNTLTRTYPRGLDVEVFSRAALEIAANEATDPSDREHVTPYILRHDRDKFFVHSVIGDCTDGTANWSVDTREDLDRVRDIYQCIGGRDDFGWREALNVYHNICLIDAKEATLDASERSEPIETPVPPSAIAASEPSRCKKIAIIGTAPSSRDLAPFDDLTWEIWSLSNRVVTDQIKRWTRHFELHPLEQFDKDPEARPYIAWMCQQKGPKPIYLQDAAKWPGITVGVQFPYKPLIETHGQYFTSTIAWQIAMAIHEGAEEIGLWGVDLMMADEYAHQRPCVENLLGFARARGIRITVPPQSSLMKPQQLYGMAGQTSARVVLQEHMVRLEGLARAAQVERDTAQGKMCHMQGAVEGLTFAQQFIP